jgi:hypothetical protein
VVLAMISSMAKVVTMSSSALRVMMTLVVALGLIISTAVMVMIPSLVILAVIS